MELKQRIEKELCQFITPTFRAGVAERIIQAIEEEQLLSTLKESEYDQLSAKVAELREVYYSNKECPAEAIAGPEDCIDAIIADLEESEWVRKCVLCNSISEFESYMNDSKIKIVSYDAKGVQQSYTFQDHFMAVVVYEEQVAPQSTERKEGVMSE